MKYLNHKQENNLKHERIIKKFDINNQTHRFIIVQARAKYVWNLVVRLDIFLVKIELEISHSIKGVSNGKIEKKIISYCLH